MKRIFYGNYIYDTGSNFQTILTVKKRKNLSFLTKFMNFGLTGSKFSKSQNT